MLIKNKQRSYAFEEIDYKLSVKQYNKELRLYEVKDILEIFLQNKKGANKISLKEKL